MSFVGNAVRPTRRPVHDVSSEGACAAYFRYARPSSCIMNEIDNGGEWFSCPIPKKCPMGDRITLAYVEGGRLSRRLIRERCARFGNEQLRCWVMPRYWRRRSTARLFDGWLHCDAAVLSGGDIGRLAVFGTVNDLAVSGAIPRWLSLSLISKRGCRGQCSIESLTAFGRHRMRPISPL